jgi:hypothetical protein
MSRGCYGVSYNDRLLTLNDPDAVNDSLLSRGYVKLTARIPVVERDQLFAFRSEHGVVGPNQADTLIRTAAKTTILSDVKSYAEQENSRFPLLDDVCEQVLRRVVRDLDAAAYSCERGLTKFQSFVYFGREQAADSNDHVVFGGADVPPIVSPEHTDKGLLTLVVQDGALGLQVFDQSTKSWVNEDASRAGHVSITVLVGHTLEQASGGKYAAARHRVVSALSNRYSLVCKLGADPSSWLSACGMSVSDVLAAFEASRSTVNPQPEGAGGRASAVPGHAHTDLTVRRKISDDVQPESTVLLSRQGFRGLGLLRMQQKKLISVGPIVDGPSDEVSGKFPLLSNPYFHLWVLQLWSAQYHASLVDDLKEKVLGMVKTVPTTMRSFAEGVLARVNEIDRAEFAANNTTGAFEEWVAEDLKVLSYDSVAGVHRRNYVVCDDEDEPALERLSLGLSIEYRDFILYKGNGGGPNELINLKVVTQDGHEIFFKCKMGTDLFRLMLAFGRRQGVSLNSVVFLFDAERILPGQSPHMIGMEDGDVIDVLVEQMGD